MDSHRSGWCDGLRWAESILYDVLYSLGQTLWWLLWVHMYHTLQLTSLHHPLFWKHQDLCPPLAVAEIVQLHDKHFLAFSDWNTLPVHTYVSRTSRKVNIFKIVVDYHRREMILATWGFKLSFQNDCHYLHNQLALPVCIRKLFFLTYFFIRWVPEMEHFKLSVYISVALPKALRENVYTWL